MRAFVGPFTLTLLAFSSAAGAAPDRVRDRTPSAMLAYNLAQGATIDPRELLVVLRSVDQAPQVATHALELGCKPVRQFGRRPMFLYDCEPGDSWVHRYQVLEKVPGVRWLEAGYSETLEATPDDLDASQWYHQNTGQTVDRVRGVAGADMSSLAAWDISTGSRAKVIIVVDVGLYAGHQDLAPNMWRNEDEDCSNGVDDDHNGYIDDCAGWDFGDDDNDPDPRTLPDLQSDGDPCLKWHASMIAGLAGAKGNNGVGITGVNWDVSFMNVKKHRTTSCVASSNSSIEAIVYGIDNGADVISMSFSGSSYNATFEQALQEAERNNMISVSSGGNGGENNDNLTRYPNEYDVQNKLVVVNSDNQDNIYAGSNYGPRTVDLAAPGTSLVSTSIGSPSELSYGTGSSFSAGVAAGAITLVWSAFPMLDATEITRAIKEGARRLPSMDCALTARCIRLGSRIDLYGSMALASQIAAPAITLVDAGLTELGDGDGRIEANEQVELRPVLGNTGRGPAIQLQAALTTIDGGTLLVAQGLSNVGTVNPGSSSDPAVLTPLVIGIADYCNKDETQVATLTLTDRFGVTTALSIPIDLKCAPPPPVMMMPMPMDMTLDPTPMATDKPVVEDGGCTTTTLPTSGLVWVLLAVGLGIARRR